MCLHDNLILLFNFNEILYETSLFECYLFIFSGEHAGEQVQGELVHQAIRDVPARQLCALQELPAAVRHLR